MSKVNLDQRVISTAPLLMTSWKISPSSCARGPTNEQGKP
nr:MAG TPA: hypothetical protein [Caudoviricetes sp.]